MSTTCGHLQGGEGDPAHVDACRQGRGVKNLILCGHHKWMTPYNENSDEDNSNEDNYNR